MAYNCPWLFYEKSGVKALNFDQRGQISKYLVCRPIWPQPVLNRVKLYNDFSILDVDGVDKNY